MRSPGLLIAGMTALVCQAAEAPAPLQAPLLGYTLDRAVHALRPIIGIPGAAVLDNALDLGLWIESAAIDAGSGTAVAIDRSGRISVIRLTPPASATSVTLPGRARAVFLSPSGTSAAVVMSEGSALYFLTGLSSGNPVVGQRTVDGRPGAVAISDDGNFVLAAFEDGHSLLLGSDGRQVSLSDLGTITSVAFRPSSYDGVAAGPDNRVWSIRQVSSQPVFSQIAGPADGISSPTALAVTADGNRALVANSGNATISVIDLAGATVSSAPCGCRATHFERTAARGVFGLNDASSQPLYLFDTAQKLSTFVPPAKANDARGRD